jgi:hypothetical protein
MIIYIGVPVIDGRPYAALVDSLLSEQLLGFQEGVHFLVDWEIGCSLIGHARNRLAKRFLDTKGADTLVFVDADISWKGGDLAKLAKRPEPVIGGTYRAKTDTETFHVRGPVEPLDGDLYRVSGLPGGFLKIDRKAFEQIDAQPYRSGGVDLKDYFPTGVRDGVFWGEDYGFCDLWQRSGGSVILDANIRLKHHDGGRFYTGDPVAWLSQDK